MKTTNALALSALLANSLVAAYPSRGHEHLHKKRNLVVVTEDVYETVYSTTTIWIDPTPAGGEFYEHHAPTSKVMSYKVVPTWSAAPSVQNVAPASSSVYVAPSSVETPAPSSVYVAPSSVETPAPYSSTPSSSTLAASPSSTPVASSSSVYVAPSSAYVAPSSTEALSTAASSTPSATTESSGSTYSGDVTYYNPAGGYGACGFNIADSDHVVAIPHDTWDTKGTMSNGNPWCGTSINILNKVTGKTWSAKIGDKCMGTDAVPCVGGSLDLPQGFFDEAFPGVDGRGKGIMSWTIAA